MKSYLTLFNKNLSVTYLRGLYYYKKKNYALASAVFSKLVSKNPQHAYGYFKLAMCHFRVSDWQNAIVNFERAIYLEPKNKNWQVQLNQSLKKFNHISGTIEPMVKTGQSLSSGSTKLNHRKALVSLNGDKSKGGVKKILLVPSAYSKKALADVLPFVEHYKNDFDINILVSDIEEEVVFHKDGYKLIRSKSPLAEYLIFMSDYMIDAGTINFGHKISKAQYWVSIWHGIPYKKMFVDLDASHLSSALRYGFAYEKMVSMSPFYTNIFLRGSMRYVGEVVEIGSAKVDCLFSQEENEGYLLKKQLDIPEGKKIVLYAPTYRTKGEIGLPFSASKLLSSLGENYVLVVKLHYLNDLNESRSEMQNVIDCTKHHRVTDLMKISDILISDYSSLIVDYALLNKPIVLFQYDQEEYFEDRGVYFDVCEYVEESQVVTAVDKLYQINWEQLNADNSRMINNFYPHEKGDSAYKIVKELNFDSAPRKTKDIIFLVNELHQIGGIHSFIKNMAEHYKTKYNSKIIVMAIKEFAESNNDLHLFESEHVDYMISSQFFNGACASILQNTDGYVISLHFSAHKHFQAHLTNDANSILMFHGDTKDIISREMYGPHLDWLNNQDLKNYKKLVFLTETNASLIAPHLSPEIQQKITSINNSISLKFSIIEPASFINFAYVSRLDKDKNSMALIDLGLQVKKSKSSYIINIYGDGPLKQEISDKINDFGLEQILMIRGFESNKEVIFRENCALILLSKTEGLPLVILEAYAFGRPVVVFDSYTAVHDVVLDNRTGYTVETDDFDGFVEKMGLVDKLKVTDIAEHSARFSNEKVFEEWDSLFNIMSPLEPIWVSVIVPCYNSSATVEAALKSLQNSSYKNLDVMVIDDGSVEPIGHFVECLEDPRFRYFYKENEGLGLTRNFGINNAIGKYIVFLDSDDVLYPNAIDDWLAFAEKNQLDVVSGITVRHDIGTGKESEWFKAIYAENKIDGSQDRVRLYDDTLSTNKLYRVEALKREGIYFEEGLYEDKLFTAKLYSKIKNIGLINKKVYKWMIYGENTSITTTLNTDNFKNRMVALDKLWLYLPERRKISQCTFFINHDLLIYLREFHVFNDDEKRLIFDMATEFFIRNKKHYYQRAVIITLNRAVATALLEQDFERFKYVSEAIATATQLAKEPKGV